jgi:hypothetical protein
MSGIFASVLVRAVGKEIAMNDAGQHTSANNKATSAVVVAMILGIFIVVSHHPVAGGGALASKVANVSRLGIMAQLVHGLIMVMLILLSAAMTSFSNRWGRYALTVIAANSVFSLGAGLYLIAMAFDGFVLPALANSCVGQALVCAESLKRVFTLSSEVVQVFTRPAFMSTALAVLLWSAHLAFFERRWSMALAGFLSAAVQLTALATTAVRLTPYSMLFVLAGQLIWYCAVAMFFWVDGTAGPKEVESSGIEH